MSKGDVRTKKQEYFEKLERYVREYNSVFVVEVDNVSSHQIHEVRKKLRGDAEILMGKNTMVRKVFRNLMEELPQLERLLPYVRGNVGFVFTNGDLKDIRDRIVEDRVAAPARPGAIAPLDVIVPAGPTGMDPSRTSFFQALNMLTRIVRGSIEIVSDVHLLHVGEKVGASEAALLNLLGISPFSYGLVVSYIMDGGVIFEPSILDISDEQVVSNLQTAITNVACISLAIGYPTLASVTHSLVNGYKELLALAVASDVTFPMAEKVKALFAESE